MVSQIVGYAIRGAQILFSIVVFGLSMTLIRGHARFKGVNVDDVNGLPITLGYAAFVGAATFVFALVGLATHFTDKIHERIMQGIDSFVLAINLAGGILLALKLKGANCAKNDLEYRLEKLLPIDLLNGGCNKKEDICVNTPGLGQEEALNQRCMQAQADSVFMLLTVVVLIAWLVISWVHLRRK